MTGEPVPTPGDVLLHDGQASGATTAGAGAASGDGDGWSIIPVRHWGRWVSAVVIVTVLVLLVRALLDAPLDATPIVPSPALSSTGA